MAWFTPLTNHLLNGMILQVAQRFDWMWSESQETPLLKHSFFLGGPKKPGTLK